jgi:hypothetical protein
MKKITATLPAFITNTFTTVQQLESLPAESAVGSLTYYPRALADWVQVGTAEITVTFMDHAQIVGGQIEALKEAKKKLQAETQAKLTAIDEQIGKLLCLEHKPDSEAL